MLVTLVLIRAFTCGDNPLLNQCTTMPPAPEQHCMAAIKPSHCLTRVSQTEQHNGELLSTLSLYAPQTPHIAARGPVT